ncbi:TPA: hypothetical protein N0F65_000572 [Lagenidium giganteum]|uniref:VWFD domain-containing protein n=1 Tax=Lagenidium giganteum TaxID=4803 RepID=A0AAV2Z4M9_9STRA|nr:TPA: hypothetical protein N0F65_000572 [Lagenidium giganteum]
MLVEGGVATFDISLPPNANKDKPASVTLKPGAGVRLSGTTFSFNGAGDKDKYTVMAKLNPAEQVADGAKVTIGLDWSYPSDPACRQTPQTIAMTVKKRNGCTGQTLGDPHVKSLDGATFDLMHTGVFKFVEGKNFQVHGAIRKCANAGCVYGIAVQFGDSIARLVADDKKIQLARGSSSLSDITITRQDGHANNYRVFSVSDPATYIDVNLGSFGGGAYLDVTCRLSPAMLNGVNGVLGNGNGNPADDEKNADKLAAAHKVSGANLFTCGGGCEDVKKPKLPSDSIKLDPVAVLTQGYKAVPESEVPARSSTLSSRALASTTWHLRQRRLEADEATVKALCSKVIKSIPKCDKYVEDPTFFIDSVCAKDTMVLQQMSNIDDAKLVYLRECRRQVDAVIALNANTTLASKDAAKEDRSELCLATTDRCPDNCGGRGECALNGCKCKDGYSGLACEIELKA